MREESVRRLPKTRRTRYIVSMARSPVDLTLEELAEVGVKASTAARKEAARAGVQVATLEDVGPPASGPHRAPPRRPRKVAGLRRAGG